MSRKVDDANTRMRRLSDWVGLSDGDEEGGPLLPEPPSLGPPAAADKGGEESGSEPEDFLPKMRFQMLMVPCGGCRAGDEKIASRR
jgi:hypothetical protein